MNTAGRMIQVEQHGATLILTPLRDLRELEFQDIERERDEVLWRLQPPARARNVVVDFSSTESFGSTAVGVLVRLRQRVLARGGGMALCGLSDHQREVLAVTGLADLWSVYGTRAEALEAVSKDATALEDPTSCPQA